MPILRAFLIVLIAAAPVLSAPGPQTPAAGDALAQDLIPIRSIAPDDEDFSDLMPLVSRIGGARVVALGEATHGDGAAFHAKARLIRFLHQVMGFDVLAWEAGVLACEQMDAAMRTGKGYEEGLVDCGRPTWGQSIEARATFEYVRQTQATSRPIATAGFDSQFALQVRQRTEVPGFVIAFFDRLDPSVMNEQERADLRRMAAGLIYADYYYRPGPRDFNTALPVRLRGLIDSRAADIAMRFSARETSLVRRLLDNIIGTERTLATIGQERADLPRVPNRDALMADNMLWLVREYYPDRKIIVWGHNYHIMNDIYVRRTNADLDAGAAFSFGPMGRFLKRALGDDYFAVGFFGYAGARRGDDGTPAPIPPAEPGTLSHAIKQTGAPYAWVDFRSLPPNHALREPTPERFYFWDATTTVWPRIFDAAFYIEQNTPSTHVR